VGYSTGSVEMSAIGTVTYRDGQTVYAFGHPLDDVGRRSLLLQDAYVYAVIPNPDPIVSPSYKLAASGQLEGTVTSDTPNAVIGEVGSAPPLIPIHVTARNLDTGRVLEEDTEVADETDVGLPLGSSSLDMVAPLAVAQAATDIYDGPPAAESGSMCLRLTVREARRPLQFCNRYVGISPAGGLAAQPPELATAASNDVTTALGLLDGEQFAQLHVTSVRITLTGRSGLATARIAAARAPLRVRAGHRIRVRLLVRDYRGRMRSIFLSFRIPRHARGLLVARIHGPRSIQTGSASAGGLGSFLTFALTGGGSGPLQGGATSMAQLRHEFAAIGSYDGLEVSFAGHDRRRVYRNPSVLITGQATLLFNVRR
jgi:hypothetical protein